MATTASTFPALPIITFLGFITVLIPLPWQLKAWNAGTCMYMIWTALGCLIVFVNTIAWKDHVLDVSPVWCDISTKILIGAGVGIPASSLCICRRLYIVLHVQSVLMSRKARLLSLATDLSIGLGLPLLVMILHVIVQGHRYDILEQVGCLPTIYNTLAAYFILYMWPVVLGSMSFVYASLILYHFFQRRAQFNSILSNNSTMDQSRYLRLMLLACIEMMLTIPIGAFSLYINTAGVPLQPYISWANVHYGFGFVGKYPAVIWKVDPIGRASVGLSQWLYPVCAFLFFAIFGFSQDARRNYREAFQKVTRKVYPSHVGKDAKFSDSLAHFRSQADLLSSNASTHVVSAKAFTFSKSATNESVDLSDYPFSPPCLPPLSEVGTESSFMDMSDCPEYSVDDIEKCLETPTTATTEDGLLTRKSVVSQWSFTTRGSTIGRAV